MRPNRYLSPAVVLATSLCLFLPGCRTGLHPTRAVATINVHGTVHGGQQPVTGARIQLYAVGTTGDGSAPTPLLLPAILSGANGSFNLGGLFTCPSASTLVYIVATGGNPGLAVGTNNTAINLVSIIGQCGSLSSSTPIEINEVTTVAAASALGGFFAAPDAIGYDATDPSAASAIATAFYTAIVLANTATGTSPGVGQSVDSSTTYSVPASTINTLANVLASCVNSPGGTASVPTTPCGKLFSLTGSPSDVLTAAANIEQNPSAYDTSSIYALVTTTGPFQPPLMTAPSSFSIALVPPTVVTPGPVSASPTAAAIGDTVVLTSNEGSIFTSPLTVKFGNQAASGSFSSTEITATVPSGTPTGAVGGSVTTSTQTYFFSIYIYGPPPQTAIDIGPGSLSFGNQLVATESAAKSVTVTNNNSFAVNINSASANGGSAADFPVTADTCSAQPLAAGASCTFSVSFRPSAVGGEISTLLVYINAASATATVALSGTGN